MKNFYTFLIAILVSGLGFGQFATELEFIVPPPASVPAGTIMSPVQVAFTDGSGTVDTFYDSSTTGVAVRLATVGSSLYVGSVLVAPVIGGIATFNDVIFTSSDSPVQLVAFEFAAGTGLFGISPTFSVSGFPAPYTYTYDGSVWSTTNPDGIVNPIGESKPSDKIEILAGTVDVLSATDTDIYSVTVSPGASLTVGNELNPNVKFRVINELTLKSTSNSYSSFIFDGDNAPGTGTVVGGTIKYERHVNSWIANGEGNDLISSPLTGLNGLPGQTWTSFLGTVLSDIPLVTNADELISGILPSNNTVTTYAFAPFSKSTANYAPFTSDTETIIRLTSGTGYRVATVDDAGGVANVGRNLTFSGDVLRGTYARTVTLSSTGLFRDWNLVGNPYPSYISAYKFLTNINAGAPNTSRLLGTTGIYGYKGDNSGWDIINLANVDGTSDKYLAPGQGFFIRSSSGDVQNEIIFDEDMRTTEGSDDFILGRNTSVLTFLKLNASAGDKNYETQFYFNENASLGVDDYYDGQILGTPPSFALYSHLVQDNTGLPIGLQALNPSDLVDTTVIPLGVNANQGEQITFSISESTLPDTIEVYLEDTETNTFTLLNSGDYTLTPNETLNGTGRFFLTFGNSALSITETTLDRLTIHTNQNEKTIVINGALLEGTTASLYDLQGRLVSSKQLLSSNRSQTIDVSSLSSGVYVVQLDNGTHSRTQKVILR